MRNLAAVKLPEARSQGGHIDDLTGAFHPNEFAEKSAIARTNKIVYGM